MVAEFSACSGASANLWRKRVAYRLRAFIEFPPGDAGLARR